MNANSNQQPRDLEILRKEVVRLVNCSDYYTVESARQNHTGQYFITVRSCGRKADLEFEVLAEEIIQLPVKVQLLERHYR